RAGRLLQQAPGRGEPPLCRRLGPFSAQHHRGWSRPACLLGDGNACRRRHDPGSGLTQRSAIAMRYMAWIIVLAVGSVVAGWGKNQPVQAHDKPVAYWLEELKKPDVKARKKAVVALGHVGTADPAAMPALMRAVKDPDATVRNEAVLA